MDYTSPSIVCEGQTFEQYYGPFLFQNIHYFVEFKYQKLFDTEIQYSNIKLLGFFLHH